MEDKINALLKAAVSCDPLLVWLVDQDAGQQATTRGSFAMLGLVDLLQRQVPSQQGTQCPLWLQLRRKQKQRKKSLRNLMTTGGSGFLTKYVFLQLKKKLRKKIEKEKET